MPKVKLVLQARLNSSRLPGKMLLPICKIPLIVLCAKRAMNSGHQLVVVTSKEESDDPLVKVLEENNIEYIRGSLDDVLSRFVEASKNMDMDDLIVRLTGDNPFVDGAFIEDIIKFHLGHGGEYTRSLSPQDGFPYGVSAEVITVKALRGIANSSPSTSHKEHVTLGLTEKNEYSLYKNTGEDLSYLRVTVDTFKDYLRVNKVFEACGEDLELVPWTQLIEVLKSFSETVSIKAPYKLEGYKAQSQLALGTAQLGMTYGIANKLGKPDASLSKEIIEKSLEYGIDLLDTAAAYGNSEEILGRSIPKEVKEDLLIVTKLDTLARADNESIYDDHLIALVKESVYRSLHSLGLKKLPILLLHRWHHYGLNNGIVWKTLLEMQHEDLIGKLGVSVQDPVEGLEALAVPEVSFIQIPYNILDSRWSKSGFIQACLKREDVHIQTRSTLLQGVLTMPHKAWPLEEEVAKKIALTLEELVDQYNRKSVVDLCYAYVRSQEWVDSLVVGVETLAQLEENIVLFNAPIIEGVSDIDSYFLDVPSDFLNPATWNVSDQ